MRRCPFCGHYRSSITPRVWSLLAILALLAIAFGSTALTGIWAAGGP